LVPVGWRIWQLIAGVDGCKDKWIAVTENDSGCTAIQGPCDFEELLSDRCLELIVIDIPIGLPESGS